MVHLLTPARPFVSLPASIPEALSIPDEWLTAVTSFSASLAADDCMFSYRTLSKASPPAYFAGEACRQAGFTPAALARVMPGGACWIESADRSGAALLMTSVQVGHDFALSIGFLFGSATLPRRRGADTSLRAVLPMIDHVITTAWRLESLTHQLTGCRAALDRCDMGIVLLSKDENIVFENTGARGLLDAGLGVRRAGRSVAANEMADSIRLRVAIEHVALGGVTAGKGMPTFALRRGKGQRPLLASVVAAEAKSGGADAVAAILYLFDPERDVTHLLHAACRLYGLTPVESRLTTQLVCGSSLTEAATLLRVKEMTARGYLKQVFVKTGVNRQSALVRLMMSSMIRLTADIELELI